MKAASPACLHSDDRAHNYSKEYPMEDSFNICRVTVSPFGPGGQVVAALTGTDADIPVVRLPLQPFGSVEIHLGNHDDPAGWLRTAAGELLGLADVIDGVPVVPVVA